MKNYYYLCKKNTKRNMAKKAKVVKEKSIEDCIWDSANKLRGNLTASEYQNVVLGLVFLKYINDCFEKRYNELIAEGDGFEEDRDEYTAEHVYSKSIEKYILVKPLDFAYNPARVNIGSIGMNEFEFDGCVSPVYVVFRCIPEYHFYIDMVRKGVYFKRNVDKLAIGGVRQTLRYEDLSRINLIIPPLSIIRDYNTFHYKIKESLKHLIQENLSLSTLRDTLLPKLMSGQIKL